MPSPRSKCLVIDTDIASAATERSSNDPRPALCRKCLEAIRQICHHVVMTPDIQDQWKGHRSNWTAKWLSSMYARKKVRRLRNVTSEQLRANVERLEVADRERETMLGDCHLIEAAIATDQIVLSLDETVRALFEEAATNVNELRTIVWVNPERVEEQPIQWLENGAEPESRRRLGSKTASGG